MISRDGARSGPAPASPLAPLSGPQFALLRRLAKGPQACGGHDAIPITYLVERGLARAERSLDQSVSYEITPAGRRFIAMAKVRY